MTAASAPAGHDRAPSTLRAAGAAWRVLLLSAVMAVAASSALAASLDSPRSAPAAADAGRAELARCVQLGRVRPEEALPALTALVPRLGGDAAAQIEALAVLGEIHALLADGAAIDGVVAELRRRGQAPAEGGSWADRSMAWARVAAEAVQSQALRLHGPVGRAERLLADAMRSPPADLPAALRLRLLAWHADLLEREGRFEPAARRWQEAIALADATPAPAWRRAEMRSALAKTLSLAGRSDRARELNQAALALAHESGDERALSYAYKTDGILQLGDSLAEVRPAAEASMRAALDHAQRAGARRDEIRAIANLADFALRRADHAQALAYAERALPLARAVHDGNA